MRKNVLLIPAIAAILTLTTLATSARALPSTLQSPPQLAQSAASDEYFYYFQGEKIPLRVLDTMIGVEFEEAFTPKEREQLIDDLKSQLVITRWQELPYLGVYLLDSEPGSTTDHLSSVVMSLRSTPGILHASLAFTYGGKTILIPRHEILTHFKKGPTDSRIAEATSALRAVSVKELKWGTDTYSMQVPGAYSLDAANRLYESGLVEWAEPDFVIIDRSSRQQSYPGPDSDQNMQSPASEEYGWNLQKMLASEAWSLTADVPDGAVRVAILDSGVKRSHPDLQENVWSTGYNAFTGQQDWSAAEPLDGCTNTNMHGTAVASVVGARTGNNAGIAGVARNHAAIVPVKIYESTADCQERWADVEFVAGAIGWAAFNADILNMSWGGFQSLPAIQEAVERATYSGKRGGLGTVFVAGTGNDGRDLIMLPASLPGVIAVGATNSDDKRVEEWPDGSCPDNLTPPCGSNWGLGLDLVAPGVEIPVLAMTDLPFYLGKGTSFSAPEVAGVAALMLALRPQLTSDQVTDILHRTAAETGDYSYDQRTGEGGWNAEMGFGRLNAYEAVAAVRDAPWIYSARILLKPVLESGGPDHSAPVAFVLRREDGNHGVVWGPRILASDPGGMVYSVIFDGVGPGVYQLCAKPEHYLGQCRTVSLAVGPNAMVDFSNNATVGAWPGDIDTAGEDNVVNALDHGVMLNYFQSHAGEANSPYDFNRDGILNTVDLLKLRITWRDHPTGDGGARAFGYPFPHGVDGTAVSADDTSEPSSAATGILSGSVSLGLQEYYSGVQGYEFDVPLYLNTNGVDTTGTTALLRYDPGLLSVRSVTFGSLYIGGGQESADDPTTGVVRMSAYSSSAPFNGSGIFATVRFMPHHGTNGTLSVMEVWLEGDETYHSVVAQNVTAANQLGAVGMEYLNIMGDDRLFNGIEVTPGSNSYITRFSLPIEAAVHDPYSQVRRVDFSAYYDGDWHTIGTDDNPVDGWSVTWDNFAVADQVIQLSAHARLPGDMIYHQTNSNIALDRTPPTYVNSSFTPPSPSEWANVTVQVSTSDAPSGVRRIEMYVNSAPDGSTSGTWNLVAAVETDNAAVFNWNTSGLEGTYQIAFAIQDNAGNWNRWDTAGLPTITYEVRRPCYTLTRMHTGSGGDPVANPTDSAGCPSGQYVAGASISLTASPASGWRVSGWSGTNNDASASTTNSLTMPASNRTVGVNYMINNPPPAPSLLSPENGSTVPSTYDVPFFWNAATGATEYLIELWRGSYSPMQPCGWSSSTSCLADYLVAGSTYSWHVKARNSAGESTWSSTWTFAVQPGVIQPGYRIVGAIASPGEEDGYRYNASSAGWISVRMFSDGSVDPFLKLTTDSGGLLTMADNAAGSSPEFFSYPLPRADVYRIITAGGASTAGGYRLALAQGRGATECDINHDCVIDDLDKDKMVGCWATSGPVPSNCLEADINLDDKVDEIDLGTLLNQWGRTCIDNTPTVAVGLQGSDVRLSWDNNAMNTGGYIVWRSVDPFFQPHDTGAISTALPEGTTSYPHSGAASSGAAWFYLVQGVSGSGMRSPVSNRTGAFGFGLAPGAVQGMTPQPQ